MTYNSPALSAKKPNKWIKHLKQFWPLYLFLLPALLDVIVFRYAPMYGLQIAFRDFKIRKGFWGSEWVGLEHFVKFLNAPNFWQLLRNTLSLSVKNLLWGFPVPVLLALMLNEIRSSKVKRVVQTINANGEANIEGKYVVRSINAPSISCFFKSCTTRYASSMLDT